MSGIKAVEEVIRDIKKVHDADPKGWKVLRGRDDRGHYDTYVSHVSGHLWHLKTERANPYRHVGVGGLVLRELEEDINEIMSHGRPLPFGEIYPQSDQSTIIALGLGKYSHEGANDLKGILSSKQREMESRLNTSLDQMLHQRGHYSEYG